MAGAEIGAVGFAYGKGTPKPSNIRCATAAAESLQSCLTLCNPIDSSPPGSSVHRILQARILEWVAISFSLCVLEIKNKVLSENR